VLPSPPPSLSLSVSHTHTHGYGKTADEVNLELEGARNTLPNITEKSGNLRKDLKQDMVDSVSKLNIFVKLKTLQKDM
jgi:hypothetical protein